MIYYKVYSISKFILILQIIVVDFDTYNMIIIVNLC